MTPVDLSLLVPIYQERVNLEQAVPALLEAAAACTPDFEILVVDDGSRDHGPALLRRMMRRHPRLRLVSHPRNLGPGAALPTGLFWARGRWMLFVPADLACRPEDLPSMWRAREGADLVVALRSDRSDYGPWRKLLSLSYIALIRSLSGSRVQQFNYLQMVRRELFERLELRSRGVFVTAEIILRAEQQGARIAQVPLRYVPRKAGKARGASPRASLRCAWELARHLWIG